MNPLPIFCDWITVKQTHTRKHKPLYGGITTYQDAGTGEINKTYQFKSVNGRYKTSVQIRSDGYTVEYSGNPSKFDQPDNVQGFSLDKCKTGINKLMVEIGLPEFTSEAKFTRIDITQNFKTGSPRRRDIYLQWIQSQNYPKLRKTLFGLNTYFGKETESRTFRIYDKALEIRTKQKKMPQAIAIKLDQLGAIRFEIEYRKILKTRRQNTWNTATQGRLIQQFLKDIKLMNKSIEKIDISEMPNNVKGTYALYAHGYNPKQQLSESTFKRHKKILLQYGVDISNTATRLVPKKEIISLQPIGEAEIKEG